MDEKQFDISEWWYTYIVYEYLTFTETDKLVRRFSRVAQRLLNFYPGKVEEINLGKCGKIEANFELNRDGVKNQRLGFRVR